MYDSAMAFHDFAVTRYPFLAKWSRYRVILCYNGIIGTKGRTTLWQDICYVTKEGKLKILDYEEVYAELKKKLE